MKNNRDRILFLCSQPAGYFLNCIQMLQLQGDNRVLLIHWPSGSNAPFNIDLSGIDVIDKSNYSLKELMVRCAEFAPDIVFIAGWLDKEYLKIGRKLRSKGAIVIGGLDNPWKGTLRQRLSSLLSGILVRPIFDYLWVPGSQQSFFAAQLGYPSEHILKNLYVADIHNFANAEKKDFEKYLVFVGRFEQEKGIDFLIETFNSLTDSERNGWKLRMIGNGSLRQKYKSSSLITIEDFMQPDTLAESTRDAGGFILPSSTEPWGVVVQEFAAAGLPLILSDAVSSGEMFLIDGQNGFQFKNGNKVSLKEILIRFFRLDDSTLKNMGRKSYDLAVKLTPDHWIAQLKSVKTKDANVMDV